MPVPGGLQAFRQMLEESLVDPARGKVAHSIRGALNRSLGKDTNPAIRTGVPDFPSKSILDYSDFGADPMGHLSRKDIVLPKTQLGLEAILPPFRSSNKMQEILDAANRGASRGGHLWYNTAPLFDFANKYAPEADVHQFLRVGAPFSAQTAVDKEIKQGAFANYFLQKYGQLPTPDEMMEIEKSILGGGGSLADKLQWAKESLEGGKLKAPENEKGELAGKTKLVPYDEARRGNQWNAVMDAWMLGGLGINQMSAPPKKGGAEMGMKLLAERAGMTPRNFQAAAWTGMNGDTRPYAQILDDLVSHSAENIGKNPHEHMGDVLSGKDYIRDEPAHFAEGGLAKYIRMRLQQEAKRASYGPMKSKLEQWGREPISDPFDVSPSGRKAVAMGEDKVLKIVGSQPRGFREQELEGDSYPGLLLPQLHYRSPDAEMTVLERIMNTNPRYQSNFMDKMQQAYDRNETGATARSRHRDDPRLSNMMSDRGLDPFKEYDLLGGDFFHPSHWGFRGNYLGPKSSSPVLLDAGALDPMLTKPSTTEDYMPQMRDVSHLRADWLANAMKRTRPPDFSNELHYIADENPENLIFKFPDLELGHVDPLRAGVQRNRAQMPLEYADGGRIRMRLARAAAAFKPRHDDSEEIYSYAGGGEVRNWLRGVKGSGIDKVLTELKSRFQNPLQANPENLAAHAPAWMREAANPNQARNEAMTKWIDRNLGNYIVRQLGTADDPLSPQLLRLAGDDRQTGSALSSLIRRIPAAQVPERLVPSHFQKDAPAYNEWMAAFKGPEYHGFKEPLSPTWLQKLIEQDTPRNTKAAEVLKAASEKLAKAGGNRDLVKAATQHYNKAVGAGALGDYKFEGLPDPIFLHDIDPQNWERYMREPMQGMMDYLSQNYTPEQLNKISVPDAMKGSIDWHEALAKKKAEVMKDPFAGTTVHKEYPTGYKWVKFDPTFQGQESAKGKEGYSILEEALKKEGDAMGHCVGGYCDDVISGQSHIYSLRDPQGQPHVTVEVNPSERALNTETNKFEPIGASISQIKGKGNKKPADQYLPYVQDFVRSGKWGEVGDLQNTGLEQVKPWGHKGAIYATPEELTPFRRYRFTTPDYKDSWLSIDDMIKSGEYEDPEKQRKYLNELTPSRSPQSVRYEVPDDWQPQGFAEGGGIDLKPAGGWPPYWNPPKPVQQPKKVEPAMSGVRGFHDDEAAEELLGLLSESA